MQLASERQSVGMHFGIIRKAWTSGTKNELGTVCRYFVEKEDKNVLSGVGFEPTLSLENQSLNLAP